MDKTGAMGKVEVHSRDTNPVVKDAHGVKKAQHYIAIISAELVGLCRRSRGQNLFLYITVVSPE